MPLHDYQIRMADHVVANPANYLALPVGMGKSAISLTALRQMLATGEVWSVLVVAPKLVAEETWPSESATWAPDVPIRLIAGTPKERMAAVMDPAPIHIIGIDNVAWLVEQYEGRWPYQALVIDEAQKFKDQSSKRFKALKKVRKHFDRVLLMSATPASESYLGLWSQLFLLDGGQRLGRTFSQYRSSFFESDYMGWNWTLRRGAEQQIQGRISDVTVSMRAEDYLNLPDRIDNVIRVTLPDAARRAVEALQRDFVMPYRGEVISAANAAVLAGKLLQISGGMVYDEVRNVVEVHEEKLKALEELVDSANGNPVLVFYGYRHEVDAIQARIKGAEPLDVTRWNAGEQKVALAHPASAGAGLNLQHGGNVICWYSLPWSLGSYIQACGRLHRQGQKQTVVIHHLIVAETIDEDVMAALQSKADAQDRLLNALRRRINENV